MVIRVDIDGTICKTVGADYKGSIPFGDKIKKINSLYDNGHTIIYWTARGATTGIDWTDLTRQQLDEWGCKFNSLEKKPFYDLHIDDKSKRIEEI